MFRVNDFVFCNNRGVCRVLKIEDTEEGLFYLLEALNPKITLKINVNNQNLRSLLTKDQIDEYIDEISIENAEWLSNIKERNLFYQKVITEYHMHDLLKLIKMIFLRNKNYEQGVSFKDKEIYHRLLDQVSREFEISLGFKKNSELIDYVYDKTHNEDVYLYFTSL